MPGINRHLSMLIAFYNWVDAPHAKFAPPATAQDFADYRAAFGEDVPLELAEVYAVAGGGPLLGETCSASSKSS